MDTLPIDDIQHLADKESAQEEFFHTFSTTAMHADDKIRALMGERHSVYNQVTEPTNRIKNGYDTVARMLTTLWDTCS
jgi:chromosomal replication initiation ATPase DnaA